MLWLVLVGKILSDPENGAVVVSFMSTPNRVKGITGELEFTVILSACFAVCTGLLESATLTVNEEIADVVGEPEMIPDDEPIVSPAGRVPELMLNV